MSIGIIRNKAFWILIKLVAAHNKGILNMLQNANETKILGLLFNFQVLPQ